MKMNSSLKLTCILLAGTFVASACTQVYSQAPLGTPTLIPTGLFVSPFPAGQDPLKIVADLGTHTAMARTAIAGGTTTPGSAANATATLGTAITVAVTTPAPATVMPGTPYGTPPATVQSPGGSAGRPASYTLQAGEFPYCIARRFDVNPDDLLSINGIASGALVYPGMTLTIPQSGSFPGDRATLTHPDTYTVDSPDTTIYGVACAYGDVLPEAIASANGLTVSSSLTVGQQLTIP
jgi:LysM repeat protein